MRVMTLADIDAVLEIEQAVQAYPWTRGNFCDALDSGYLCCVDDAEGVLRSFAVLMLGVDEAELLNIAVAAAHQRFGLGEALLLNMMKMAASKNCLRVFLEVRVSNQAAIALYGRVGFSEVGVRRAYYRNANDSEDALVMACDSDRFVGELHG